MLRDALPKIVTELPGPKSKAVIEKRAQVVASTIACATPCVINKAEGAVIEDLDGNIFLDWVGGIGVMNIGHSHPEVVEAVQKQAARYFHPQANTIHYAEYVELADKLNKITPGDFKKRTALFNSGAEGIENAVKVAKKYTKRTEIIAFSGAFHGRTSMAMALTSAVKPNKASFGPLTPGVHRAQYPNTYRTYEGVKQEDLVKYYIDKLEEMFIEYVAPENVAAIILEPVQGENGFIMPPKGYMKELGKICNKYGILLIADEIQTGYCRTGKMFATEYWALEGVYADILVSAKSMAGGIPISAVTGREEIMEACEPGELGGTYGGNALACASALTVINIMERDNFADKSVKIGKKCMDRFAKWYEKYDVIGEYRGIGAMVAVEFVNDRATKEPNTEIVNSILKECKYNGLIMKNAGAYGQTIRLLTPLVVTDEQLDAGLDIFENAIAKFSAR